MTKSYAPSFIASTAVSTVPKAVITMTSMSGPSVRTALSTSSPVIPGILRSVRMRSGEKLPSLPRALNPSAAVSVS